MHNSTITYHHTTVYATIYAIYIYILYCYVLSCGWGTPSISFYPHLIGNVPPNHWIVIAILDGSSPLFHPNIEFVIVKAVKSLLLMVM